MTYLNRSKLIWSMTLILIAFLAACSGGGSGSAPASTTYSVSGTVTGLTGTGLAVRINGGGDLSITTDGVFTFTVKLNNNDAYNVTVFTQPSSPSETCTVNNGNGTISGSDISNVTVICNVNTYTVGGLLSGLASATSIVLQNNGGDNISLSADGNFTFTTPVASGANYAVSVFAQPAGQTCSVANSVGTIGGGNATNIGLSCAPNTYTVGGSVSGLTGTLVLQDNGGDDLSISINGPFSFASAMAHGLSYAVTVKTQPLGQHCTLSNSSGTVSATNITNVTAICSTNSYIIGGTLSGLLSSTYVVLRNNGGDDLTLYANGSFSFITPILSGSSYNVTIYTQPSVGACSVGGGSGTVAGANVTGAAVACSAVCGDGVVSTGEVCDDGNTVSETQCPYGQANCTACSSTCTTLLNLTGGVCGNNVIEGTESCDDGNLLSGDGCSSSCTVETGWNCNSSPSTCSTSCGDGIVAGSEQCDDGNTVNGDGCASACQVESGFTCSGSPSVCTILLPNGSACAQGNVCQSGFCADGVCCNSACNGGCQACSLIWNGVADGICGNVADNTDPKNYCPSGGASVGLCASGACY